MSEVNLTVHPFRMGNDKEASLKPLEEAAEVYAAWQGFKSLDDELNLRAVSSGTFELAKEVLADEIADCIQACVNLADRYNLDLQAAMELCEKRNRERGRYK